MRIIWRKRLIEPPYSYQDDPGVQSDVIDAGIFVLDFIAQIRVLTKEVPETFEHLALKILQSIPEGYTRVDIVADTYRASTIKTAERNKRGMASKIAIKSEKSKIPRVFNSFLMNGDNKSRLIDIVFGYIIQNKAKCLQIVRANRIILSRDGECQEVTQSSLNRLDALSSNQEEADTNVILYTLDALDNSPNSKVHLNHHLVIQIFS